MDIKLHPTVSLLPEAFSVLVAPVEMLAKAQSSQLELQHYKILFICGNYSRILSRLDRNNTSLEMRRDFTVFQFMTILEENHHSFLIVEHDPLLYEDAGEIVEYIAQALKQASREATIMLYAPALDPHLQKIMELANLGVLHLHRAGSSKKREDRGEDAAGCPENPRSVLIRWPRWRQGAIEPRRAVSTRVQKPGDGQLEERSWDQL